MKWLTRASVISALVFTCGCSSAYVSPSLHNTRDLWTLVSVQADPLLDPELVLAVRQAVAAELEATPSLEPMFLSPAEQVELEQETESWYRRPPTYALVGLSRRFGADAVAVLRLRHFDPYPPASVSLQIQIHSTETGALLFASSGEHTSDWLSPRLLARVAARRVLAPLP
ncbi:MAG: hypothetical protein JKY65_31995 [Planctomycetes bacterium]|nr:hypothetical protein [Planctomycetota bacterium]